MNIGDLFLSLKIDSAEFQKSVGGISSMALGAIGIVGVAIAGLGVKAAAEWETAFLGVRKTVDASEEDFDILEGQLRDLAGVIPLPATELAKLAETAGALGIAKGDIAEFVRITAMIGTTTNVSADMAATSLGQLSNVLGLTGEDYERFGSALVDLGNKGASTEQDILAIATRAGGAADLIGIAAAETLGWSSAVANLGIDAEAGGSSLQRFFLRVNELTSSEGGLAKLTTLTGLTAEEFQNIWKNDPTGALVSIIDALSKLDASARAQALKDLGFNDIRITRMLLGMAGNVDNLTDSVNIGRDAWDKNAAMQVEFEKKASGVEAQLQLLFNDLHDIAITLGDALLPHIRTFIGLIRGVAQGIGDWMKQNKGLVDTITPILTVLSGILALKFGTQFIGGILGQLGGGILSRTLLKMLAPQLLFAGTSLGGTIGGAQGTAHATAAGSQGVIRQIVAKVAAMQLPLAAAGTTVGTAVGTAMALGIAAGIILIGTHVIAEAVNNATNAAREKIANNPNAITTADLFQSRAPAWAVKKLEVAKQMQDLGTAALAAFNAEWERGLGEGLMASDPALLERARQAGLAIGGTTGAAATDALVEEGILGGEAWARATLDGFANADWSAATAAVQAHGRETAIAGQEAILDVFRNGDWGAAAEAARGVIAELNRGLQDSLPSARTAWKDFVDGIGKELDPLDELAWLQGKLSGKKLRDGLSSENPFARQDAEDTRDIILGEIAKLERLLGIEGEQGGDALGDSLGNQKNKNNAEDAAATLAENARKGFAQQPWNQWGGSAYNQWENGFLGDISKLNGKIKAQIRVGVGALVFNSPAKEGPLRDLGKWGKRAAHQWLDPFVATLGAGLNLSGLTAPGMGALNMPILRGGATVQLHHTVDIKGDASNLDERKVADYLNEGAAGFAWNLEHAMSAVTSG